MIKKNEFPANEFEYLDQEAQILTLVSILKSGIPKDQQRLLNALEEILELHRTYKDYLQQKIRRSQCRTT